MSKSTSKNAKSKFQKSVNRQNDTALYRMLFPSELSKGELRRLQILQASIDCLTEVGLENASFEEIAKRINSTGSHILYYFADKNALMENALKLVTATAQQFTVEYLKKNQDPEQRLKAFVEATFEWFKAFPKHAQFMCLFYYRCVYRENFRELHRQIRETGRARIEAMILESASLSAEVKVRARALSRAIQALLTGYILDLVTAPSSETECEKVKLEALDVISVLLEKNLRRPFVVHRQ